MNSFLLVLDLFPFPLFLSFLPFPPGVITHSCNSPSYRFRTYLWFDEKGKKTRVAAPQYIDYVMTFTQRTVSDETIFPTKYGKLSVLPCHGGDQIVVTRR